MLVLVVVLVLDLLGFCGEKGIRLPVMILFYSSDGETSAFSSTSTSRSTSTKAPTSGFPLIKNCSSRFPVHARPATASIDFNDYGFAHTRLRSSSTSTRLFSE